MTELVEINFTTRCDSCASLIRWIDCPTGGWWSHDVHPADHHDAVTKAELEEDASMLDLYSQERAMLVPTDVLVVEHRRIMNGTKVTGPVSFSPALGEDYWAYRVRLTDRQAVLGFPKYTTIGVGFAVEDYSGNTNLPYTCDTDQILRHISGNKGDDSIADDKVRAAIALVQEAIRADQEAGA